MASLNETSTWEAEIYQIEVVDRVSGGPDGIANIQPRQLANRSTWLKNQVTTLSSQVSAKAPINNPTFTGTVNGITPSMIGLGNVSNVADSDKSVYAATKLVPGCKINGVDFNGSENVTIYDNTKAPANNPVFTGTVTFSDGCTIKGLDIDTLNLGNVDNTADAVKNVLSATKLTTPRKINGVNFDGTQDITIYDTSKEPAFAKNTAFNKNFGTAVGTVCQGNDSRLADARPPLAHKMSSAIYHTGFTLSSAAPSGGSDGDLWFKYSA